MFACVCFILFESGCNQSPPIPFGTVVCSFSHCLFCFSCNLYVEENGSSTLYNFSPCSFCSLHGLAQHILTEFNKDFQQRYTFISLEGVIQTPRPVASSPFTGFLSGGLLTSLCLRVLHSTYASPLVVWCSTTSFTKSQTVMAQRTYSQCHLHDSHPIGVSFLSPPLRHISEKAMAPHSSTLVWRIPGTGEPGGLPSVGSHRVRHDWSDLAAVAAGIFTIFLKVRLRSPWKLSIIEWEESVDAEARNIRVRLLDWLLLKILWSCTSYWISLTFSAFIYMMGMLQALNEAKQSMLPIV